MLKKLFFSDSIIFSAIAANAIVIFLMSFREMESDIWLYYIDHFFIIFFLLEALVKLFYLKPKAYFADNWNRFDFFLVIVSLPTLLADYFPIPNTSILLVLRLLRLFRLVRLFRFIPNMEHILTGLGRALKASVFVIVALLFLNFFIALFTCHIYRDICPQFFGDPLTSIYTIFQLFTVEGWNEIPSTIAANTNSSWMVGLSRFYFVMVVLIGGIFGMSLANAVFVDEMTMDNNKGLEDKIDTLQAEIQELKQIIRQNKP